ncbi:MAG: hypothetical protein HW403_1347, partial [Dehalococcoidia bacterium]|nr:hypothetical protein [Dehalococcoidia bacterium]
MKGDLTRLKVQKVGGEKHNTESKSRTLRPRPRSIHTHASQYGRNPYCKDLKSTSGKQHKAGKGLEIVPGAKGDAVVEISRIGEHKQPCDAAMDYIPRLCP